MKEFGGMLLKTVSVMASIMGIIIVFVAMFFLYDTMMATEYSVSNKLNMLMWFAVLAEGVAFGLFGFYGAMNAMDYDEDANKRCIKNGVIMLLCSIANGVITIVKYNFTPVANVIVIAPLMVISLLYILSTVLKIQGMKKEPQE